MEDLRIIVDEEGAKVDGDHSQSELLVESSERPPPFRWPNSSCSLEAVPEQTFMLWLKCVFLVVLTWSLFSDILLSNSQYNGFSWNTMVALSGPFFPDLANWRMAIPVIIFVVVVCWFLRKQKNSSPAPQKPQEIRTFSSPIQWV